MSDDPQMMKFNEPDAGGSSMWMAFEDELFELDPNKPLLLTARQLSRLQYNIKYLRIALKEKLLVGAPHNGPEHCPTYYDGCNCSVQWLESLIEDNEKLRKQFKALNPHPTRETA